MAAESTGKLSLSRRWWPLIPLVVIAAAAAFLWRPLTQASTPEGLFEMAVDHYQSNPHLFPFSTTFNGEGVHRLAGLTDEDARAAFDTCPRRGWRKIGVVPPQYPDEPYDHIWECDASEVLVRGRVKWDPSWGMLGAGFSACRKTQCPEAEFSFDPTQYEPSQPSERSP